MFLIGIAGGSGSGKTTFARKLIEKTGDPSVCLVQQDAYYHRLPPESLRVNGQSNFDHPEAFDWELFRDHLGALKRGLSVNVPVYDYVESRRTTKTLKAGPADAVVVEGIFTLWDAEVRDLYDLKIYLDVAADIRFIRRLHRDVRERGRTLDGIVRQYYNTVRPMHHEFLEPTRQYADLVVGEETDLAADTLAARLIQVIQVARCEELS